MKTFDQFENKMNESIGNKYIVPSWKLRDSGVFLTKMKNENKYPYIYVNGTLKKFDYKTRKSFDNDRTYVYFIEENKANTLIDMKNNINNFVKHIDDVFAGVIAGITENNKEVATEYSKMLNKMITLNKELDK
ncbi:hypothetical protein M0Q50_00870 [bacterium]|jgi:hypothetical protein|nr:hypothetical protein [bacterium]